MKTIETKVYTFDELNDKAKEQAREWYRNGALDYEWWESTYEDAAQVGLKLTSFDLERNRHACGEFITGALGCAQSILKNHGEHCETFKTASQYLADRQAIFDKYPQDEYGELDHAGGDALETLNEEFLKAILEDYSIMLEKEYEWLLSDEQVDESILANEYTFTETGKRFG